MKTLLLLIFAALLLGGCATQSSLLRHLEKRKQERYAAYSALTPEQKAAVDAGQIKVGLGMDAVYIAWGKPSQVTAGETTQGAQTIWLYTGTYLQSHHYWSYSPSVGRGYGRRGFAGPSGGIDHYPVPYVSGEVVFEGGVVKQWRTLPSPGG